MIVSALAAGAASVFIIVLDAVRAQGRPFALARAFVAGAWAVSLLSYGFNITGFPSPARTTLIFLGVAWAGSIAMVPPASLSIDPGTTFPSGRRTFVLMTALVLIGVFLVSWDIFYLARRFSEAGLWNGLKNHRLDRVTATGAFWLPGLQLARALAQVAGALAFARWYVKGQRSDLAIAALGLLAAILSTGRWEVVSYCVWLFLVGALSRNGSHGLRWQTRQAALLAALAVFFVAHGQLFGKNDHVVRLAALPAEQRIESAGTVVLDPAHPAATSPVPAQLPKAVVVSCPRWTESAVSTNLKFRALPRQAVGIVLYAAGPFAALDRVLCQGPEPIRQVIFYWPYKIARLTGFRAPETVLAVDPFVDIGVPFNNYTVIHSFLFEVGPWLGCALWIVVALAARVASGKFAQAGHPALIVAAAAPLSMAVRTPWTNTFFDGTLVIWVAVALALWWASTRDGGAAIRG